MLVGLDLETTGVDPHKDQPVQMAAVCVRFPEGVASTPKVLFNGYCNPSIPIQEEAEGVHGISPEMVRFAPTPKVAATTMGMLIELAHKGHNVFTVGYNSSSFDIPILGRFDKRFYDHAHIDVYTLCLRELHEHGLKLTELYESYVGKESIDAHDAAADIFFTLEILMKYMETSEESLEELCVRLNTPTVCQVFPFGKYKGKPIKGVPPSYAKWCLKNFDNVTPDLQMTLEWIAKGRRNGEK
jgi:DNA polymerase III epsilon subunit-like protein